MTMTQEEQEAFIGESVASSPDVPSAGASDSDSYSYRQRPLQTVTDSDRQLQTDR
jgi:hypothetical protein